MKNPKSFITVGFFVLLGLSILLLVWNRTLISTIEAQRAQMDEMRLRLDQAQRALNARHK